MSAADWYTTKQMVMAGTGAFACPRPDSASSVQHPLTGNDGIGRPTGSGGSTG